MGIAFAMLAIGAVLAFGAAVLVMYLRKLSQLKRHPLRQQMEVRFSPRGLVGLALLVGVMLLTVSASLLLVVYRDLPPYAVSFAVLLMAAVARPLYLSKAGLPFVVIEIGAELNPKPVPAAAAGGAAPAPQYPGFAAPAGYTAPQPPAQQYNDPAGYTAPPPPYPGKQ